MEKVCWLCGGTVERTIAQKLGTPITEIGLSSRAKNCLRWRRIETVEELVKLSADDLFRVRGLGKITAKELKEKVKAFGFDWNIQFDENCF